MGQKFVVLNDGRLVPQELLDEQPPELVPGQGQLPPVGRPSGTVGPFQQEPEIGAPPIIGSDLPGGRGAPLEEFERIEREISAFEGSPVRVERETDVEDFMARLSASRGTQNLAEEQVNTLIRHLGEENIDGAWIVPGPQGSEEDFTIAVKLVGEDRARVLDNNTVTNLGDVADLVGAVAGPGEILGLATDIGLTVANPGAGVMKRLLIAGGVEGLGFLAGSEIERAFGSELSPRGVAARQAAMQGTGSVVFAFPFDYLAKRGAIASGAIPTEPGVLGRGLEAARGEGGGLFGSEALLNINARFREHNIPLISPADIYPVYQTQRQQAMNVIPSVRARGLAESQRVALRIKGEHDEIMGRLAEKEVDLAAAMESAAARWERNLKGAFETPPRGDRTNIASVAIEGIEAYADAKKIAITTARDDVIQLADEMQAVYDLNPLQQLTYELARGDIVPVVPGAVWDTTQIDEALAELPQFSHLKRLAREAVERGDPETQPDRVAFKNLMNHVFEGGARLQEDDPLRAAIQNVLGSEQIPGTFPDGRLMAAMELFQQMPTQLQAGGALGPDFVEGYTALLSFRDLAVGHLDSRNPRVADIARKWVVGIDEALANPTVVNRSGKRVRASGQSRFRKAQGKAARLQEEMDTLHSKWMLHEVYRGLQRTPRKAGFTLMDYRDPDKVSGLHTMLKDQPGKWEEIQGGYTDKLMADPSKIHTELDEMPLPEKRLLVTEREESALRNYANAFEAMSKDGVLRILNRSATMGDRAVEAILQGDNVTLQHVVDSLGPNGKASPLGQALQAGVFAHIHKVATETVETHQGVLSSGKANAVIKRLLDSGRAEIVLDDKRMDLLRLLDQRASVLPQLSGMSTLLTAEYGSEVRKALFPVPRPLKLGKVGRDFVSHQMIGWLMMTDGGKRLADKALRAKRATGRLTNIVAGPMGDAAFLFGGAATLANTTSEDVYGPYSAPPIRVGPARPGDRVTMPIDDILGPINP